MMECQCINEEIESSIDVSTKEGNVSPMFRRRRKMLNHRCIDTKNKISHWCIDGESGSFVDVSVKGENV